MTSMIFGVEGAETLHYLSRTLRQKTLDFAVEVDGEAYPFYTPWLCMRPVLDQSMSDVELCKSGYIAGSVVVDRGYLQSVSHFLETKSHFTRDFLIGTHEDWDLLEDVSERAEVVPMLDQARGLIQTQSKFFASIYPSLVEIILPLRQPRPRGWTCHFARGVVFIGFESQYDKFNLALDIVHEMGHQALALFQSADRLIASDWNTPVYSEVRRTHRPAMQSLQAAAAIAFMTYFAKEAGFPRYIHPEFDDPLPHALKRATSYLRQACEFTPVGAGILGDFEKLAVDCFI